LTVWTPDSCHCKIDLDSMTFIEQCKTHNVPQQTIAHNRAFNRRNGDFPTGLEIENQQRDKALEKVKPEFQRR